MSLDTYTDPASLYTARGEEVNPNRPLFTGDVFGDIAIPGVPDSGMAMIVAHPCSFRGAAGQLADRVLVATVRTTPKQGPKAWTRGLFDRMPLTDSSAKASGPLTSPMSAKQPSPTCSPPPGSPAYRRSASTCCSNA